MGDEEGKVWVAQVLSCDLCVIENALDYMASMLSNSPIVEAIERELGFNSNQVKVLN